MVLDDFFRGSPFVVELEKDLSLKRQLLDVIIVRRFPGPIPEPMPEGLEELAAHNLITFKSHHEALDDSALKELTGHYVNYRKQVSPSLQQLLPEEEFRLYAVCARFPQKLASQAVWEKMRPGIYQCRRGTDAISVMVLRQLPKNAHNAVWHLFSAVPEQVRYAADVYHQRDDETSTLLNQLFESYKKEGLPMPYTMADFRRDYVKEHLKDLTVEERLEGLPPEEIRKAVPLDELLKGLSARRDQAVLEASASERSLQRLFFVTRPEFMSKRRNWPCRTRWKIFAGNTPRKLKRTAGRWRRKFSRFGRRRSLPKFWYWQSA